MVPTILRGQHPLKPHTMTTQVDDDMEASALREKMAILWELAISVEAKMANLRKEADVVVDQLYTTAAFIVPVHLQVLLNLGLQKVVNLLEMDSWESVLKSHSSVSATKGHLPDYIHEMFESCKIPPPSTDLLVMLSDYGTAHWHLQKQGKDNVCSASRSKIRYQIVGPFDYPCRQTLGELYEFVFGTLVDDDGQDDVYTTSTL